MDYFNDSCWIWLERVEKRAHQYVCFRKRFDIDETDSAAGILRIAADTDFVAYLNGKEIGRGQFSDYPEHKTYSSFECGGLLRSGENLLCVMGYYCGEDFFTYRAGESGLIAELRYGDKSLVSDETWRCVESPAFQSGGLPRLTSQLGFVSKYDARKELDWLCLDFDDSKWTEPVVRAKTLDGFWKTLEPRPVPPLLLKERVSTRIVMQGRLFREREFDTFADTVANDFLTHFPLNRFFDGVEQEFPAPYPELDGKGDANWMFQPPEPLANGCFLVVDLGSEYVGLIDIELSASSGTVIDISHGEHLLDGKVRNKIGDRNFTDRYVCKDGVNRYVLPFRRIGGRYLQLNITKMDCSISIKYVGIRPLEAPRPPAGDFISGDRVADLTHEVGVRTLELCMHEHYEDCPWREQALYAYDSRNQALYGYYVWGNYKFAKASLDLLGKGVRSDGFLEICAPAKSIRTIPIFSFVWVSEINEYWLHSGDDSLFREFDSQMEFMIGARLKNCDRRNGLYTFGDDDGLWHFYEWAPGLSVVDVEKDEHHAPYNLYFIEMLESYSAMLRRAGRTAEAEKYLAIAIELKEAVHKSFWDSNKRCYASKMINGELTEYHDHIQFLAIYNDIVPEEKRGELLTKISSRSLESLTLSAMPYMLRSMMKISSDAREYAAKVVFSVFSKMILAGATSLWETQEGPDAFGGAGSLCHAWSSLPVYYHLAYVLGVRPIEPGFRTFAVSPYSNGFGAVKGSIPTPSGMIDVEWTRNDDGLRLEMSGPENLTPILEELPDSPICSANYNNTPMK